MEDKYRVKSFEMISSQYLGFSHLISRKLQWRALLAPCLFLPRRLLLLCAQSLVT